MRSGQQRGLVVTRGLSQRQREGAGCLGLTTQACFLVCTAGLPARISQDATENHPDDVDEAHGHRHACLGENRASLRAGRRTHRAGAALSEAGGRLHAWVLKLT